MFPESDNYQKDLIFDNRRRIQILSYLILAVGAGFLIQHLLFPGASAGTGDATAYLIIYIAMLVGGLIALSYPLIFRRRAVSPGLESPLQIALTAFFLAAGVALTILDINYGDGFTAYVVVAVLSGILLRNRNLTVVLLFLAAAAAIVVGLALQGAPLTWTRGFQLTLFTAMGIALGVVRERDRRDRFDAQLQLLEQSIVDPLTDVYNRRFFIEELERTVQRRKRYGHPFCLAIIDIDQFKDVNDQFGHLVGDSVLESYAWMLLDHLRESDVVSRYGGDEFMIILSETRLPEAVHVLERLRRHFEEHEFQGIGRAITCSIGVVECPEDGVTNILIQDADELLYRAKEEGRNRVQSAAST
jgi:diguanylate cyclase (GGDEF)-like protein